MTTTTDLIVSWGSVQPDDVALHDGGLVYVTEINVLEEGHPDFLVAHVSGLHVDDDGMVTTDRTGMSPNAATLTAVRRLVKDSPEWNDSHPGVSEGTLTAALRDCWVTVQPEDGSRAASGYMVHADRVASACLTWIGSDDVGARPEVPGHDTEPPVELPPMNIGQLTEIIAGALTARTVAVGDLVRADDTEAAGTLLDAEHLVAAGLRAAAYEAAVTSRIHRELDRLGRPGKARVLASLTRAYPAAATQQAADVNQ